MKFEISRVTGRSRPCVYGLTSNLRGLCVTFLAGPFFNGSNLRLGLGRGDGLAGLLEWNCRYFSFFHFCFTHPVQAGAYKRRSTTYGGGRRLVPWANHRQSWLRLITPYFGGRGRPSRFS